MKGLLWWGGVGWFEPGLGFLHMHSQTNWHAVSSKTLAVSKN